jgi:hypothetical protein
MHKIPAFALQQNKYMSIYTQGGGSYLFLRPLAFSEKRETGMTVLRFIIREGRD